MKTVTGWNPPNTGASNSSGFSALPGGYFNESNGLFFGLGNVSWFWSSNSNNEAEDLAGAYSIIWTSAELRQGFSFETFGLHCRCVQDE